MSNRRFTITLTELLPGSMKREARNAFEIPDTSPDIERDIKLHAKAALPDAISMLASTKGFIEEDRHTPAWDRIAGELKAIADRTNAPIVMLPLTDVDALADELVARGVDGDTIDYVKAYLGKPV